MTASFQLIPDPQNNQVLARIRNMDQATLRGIRQAFYFIGRDFRKTASDNILLRPRTGRTYIIRTRSGRKRRHVASVAGESFANRTGAARRTLGFQVGGTQLEFGFLRGSGDTDYVKYLEDPSVLNRPTLRIAIQDNQGRAVRHFNREIEQALHQRNQFHGG